MMSYFYCVLTLSMLTFYSAERYDVTVRTIGGITASTISVDLIGVFGNSGFTPLGDGINEFENSGLHGPFIVETTKSIGDVLSFTIAIATSQFDLLTITQVIVNYKVTSKSYTTPQITLSRIANTQLIQFPTSLAKPNITIGTGATVSNPWTINAGENHTLQVNDEDKVSYKWYSRNNQEYELISNTSLYRITNALGTDALYYFCVLSFNEEVAKTDELQVLVIFVAVLPFSVTLTETAYITEGNDVQVNCLAISYPPNPSVRWYQGAQLLQFTNGILTFTKMLRNESGEYTCKANSGNSLDERRIFLQVNYLDEPKIKTTDFNSTVYVKKGDELNITCSTDGYPTVTYEILSDENSTLSLTPDVKTLIIQQPRTGKYFCRVKNLYFTRTQSILVNVTEAATPMPTPKVADDNEEFWTTTVIIMFAVAAAFFIIIVILIISMCYLCRKKKSRKLSYRTKPQFRLENEAQDVFYQSDGQHNPYVEDTTEKRNIQKNIVRDNRLSISSDEYKSSEAGLSISTRKNDTLTNGTAKSHNERDLNVRKEDDAEQYKRQINGMDVEYC